MCQTPGSSSHLALLVFFHLSTTHFPKHWELQNRRALKAAHVAVASLEKILVKPKYWYQSSGRGQVDEKSQALEPVACYQRWRDNLRRQLLQNFCILTSENCHIRYKYHSPMVQHKAITTHLRKPMTHVEITIEETYQKHTKRLKD